MRNREYESFRQSNKIIYNDLIVFIKALIIEEIGQDGSYRSEFLLYDIKGEVERMYHHP